MNRKIDILKVLVACSIAISCISCSNEDVLLNKTNQLFHYMGMHNPDSLLNIIPIYPDFDDSYMVIESDSFKISNIVKNKNEDGYDVEITNYYSVNHIPDNMIKKNIILTFVKNLDGDYYVKKSVGLLNDDIIPNEANETGYLKVRSKDSDVDIIEGLNVLDTIRQECLYAKCEKIKQNIKIELLWYRTGSAAKLFYRIFNNSSEYINLMTFNGTYTYKTFPKDEFHNEGIVRYLRGNSYQDVDFTEEEFTKLRALQGTLFFYSTYVNEYHLKSYEITNIEVNDKIDYNGDEYANYLKKHPKDQVPDKDKSKEEGFLSELEKYVKKVEGMSSLEELTNMPKLNKKFSVKTEYIYGVRDGGIKESDLKLTNEQKEKMNQLNNRYEIAYQKLKDTFVK